MDKYQVQFADKILAEATVGATIGRPPFRPEAPSGDRRFAKSSNPSTRLHAGGPVHINRLGSYFTINHDFYQFRLGTARQIFKDLAKSLADEIKITDEQTNSSVPASITEAVQRSSFRRYFPSQPATSRSWHKSLVRRSQRFPGRHQATSDHGRPIERCLDR